MAEQSGNDFRVFVAPNAASLPTTGWGLINNQTSYEASISRSSREIGHKSLPNGVRRTIPGFSTSRPLTIGGFMDDADTNGIDILLAAVASTAAVTATTGPVVWVYAEERANGNKGFTGRYVVTSFSTSGPYDEEATYTTELRLYDSFNVTTSRPTGVAGAE